MSISVRVHAAIARGNRGESMEIELARLEMTGPFYLDSGIEHGRANRLAFTSA